MRYRKNKKKLTLLFVAFIILIGVGYAFLFRNPKINGLSGVKTGKWVIYFDRVQNESGVVSTETKITDNKKQVDFNINLKKPGDYYEFDVDTVNDGNIDAMIDSVEFGQIDNTIEPYLDFDVSYKDGTSIEKCDLLPKNSRKTITVKVKMDEGLTEEELITQTKNLNLNFKINYVQKDVCENRPTLIVDPNGGKYNGTRKLTKIKVNKNSNTVLDEPLRTGYNFLYFTDNSGTELPKDQEGKTTVHVGNTDVKVTANWEEIPIISKYELTINPNGGVYNNSTETVSVELEEEETLTLDEPTRENYVFEGWEEVTETNSLSGNIVTMPSEPVTVRAIWNSVENYVARINTKYYTTIQKAFDAAVDGDTVHLLKSTAENGNNTKNISFNLGGFTVTGTITNSGTITVDNGRIENVISSPFVNTGTVNVGTHDGNMVADSIVIFGGENVNGLTQNGTFNFYDGYIEGKLAVTGGYNELETGYYYIVAHDNDNNCQKAYLSPDIDAIARVVINNKDIYFKLLQDAIDMTTNDNPNVYAIKDFENSTILNISDNQKLVFDLKGFNVKQGSKITNNGTFTIIDTASTKGSLSVAIAIENNGTLNLTDVTMSQSTTAGNIVENAGNINLSNSHLTAQNGSSLYIVGGGTITVDENTSLSAVEYGIYNNSSEPVTIVGGNLTGVYNNGTELTINGSSITNIGNKSYAINSANGTLNLNNVVVTSTRTGLYVNKGGLNISGGSYSTTSYYSIHIESSSVTFNIQDAYISCTNGDAISLRYSPSGTILNTEIVGRVSGSAKDLLIDQNCTISNINNSNSPALSIGGTNVNVKNSVINSTTAYAILTNSGTVNLENLVVTSTSNHALYVDGATVNIVNSMITSGAKVGIYNYKSGRVNILSGTISGKTYGVQNHYGSSYMCTITIGDNSDSIDSTKPVIIGETYGLYIEDGTTVNFYDGILKGKTDGYYGTITSLADNSTIKLGTETINDELYNTVTLKEQVKFLQVNDGDKYSSLQAAFDAVGTSGTIKVIEDASTTETSSITSNQNITFDLNGHTLETTKTITNNGTLTLVDSSLDESGLFVNNVNNLIENKKMITVNSGTYQSGKNTFNLPSSNTPKIVVNNGTILGTEYSIYSYSSAQNALYIEDGNFNSIYATNTAAIIKGGLITSPKNAGLTVGKNSSVEDLVINHSGTATSANGINIIGGTDVILRNVTVNSTSNSYSAFNKSSASKLTIEGGSYTSNNKTAISIGGGSNDKVYIDGAIITSLNDNAIQIGVGGSSSNNYGQLYLTGNTIVNGKKSGVIFVSNGTLILGEKGSSVDTSKPSIIGGEYGINGYNTYSLGNIEFYDGIVKGKIESLYNVYPDILEPVHSLKYSEEIIDGVTYQTVYLERQLGDFLQVGSSTFSTLQDAIDSITTDGTITVIGSGDLVEPSEIPSGKNITLDLNGNSITTSNTITNNGIFTLKDSSGDNSGTIYIKKNTLVENNNQLTVDSGSYISEVKMYATANIIHQNVASSNTTINGGILYGDNPAANSSLSTTIYTEKGDLTINGGTIRNKLNSPLRLGVGTTIINNVNNTEVYSDKVSSDSITCLRNQDLTINGGTFNGRINIPYGADVTINNGTIVSENGTAIDNGGTLAINAGYIKGKTYGISTGSSVLVIGSNDSTVSTSSPVIVGGTYGIGCSSNNKIEFYDGIIKGKTGRFQYTPKTIATGTNLVQDTETDEGGATILTAYLEKQIDFIENVNKSKVYKNFKTAVSEASAGDLLRLIDSSSNFEDVTIDKNLTIDLNNNSLTTSKEIVNTANLTIKDDSTQKNGMLTTASGVNTINNSGTLTTENVHLNSSSTVSGVYVIYNTGEIDLTNTSIDTTTSLGIYNEHNADLNSCNINAATGIYSYAVNNNVEMNIIDTDVYAFTNNAVNSSTSSRYKANILIDGGTYNAYPRSTNSSATFNTQNSNSDVTIQNASFVRDLNIYVNSTADNIISNKEIQYGSSYQHELTNSTVSLVRNSGDLTINDVTVNGSNGYDTGVFYNTGNVDATDLNIITTNSSRPLNNESGVFNFNSGQIINNSTSNGNYCVYINSGTFNLKSGTIKNNSTGSNDSYGIYMKDGTLTIGTYFGGGVESADVSTTNPHIEAINTSSRGNYSGIGVKVLAGTFNYYDGLIIGSTEAKPEAPTAIEPRYRVFNTTDINGYDNCVLQYVPQ